MDAMPALGRLRQKEHHEFKGILSYIEIGAGKESRTGRGEKEEGLTKIRRGRQEEKELEGRRGGEGRQGGEKRREEKMGRQRKEESEEER